MENNKDLVRFICKVSRSLDDFFDALTMFCSTYLTLKKTSSCFINRRNDNWLKKKRKKKIHYEKMCQMVFHFIFFISFSELKNNYFSLPVKTEKTNLDLIVLEKFTIHGIHSRCLWLFCL